MYFAMNFSQLLKSTRATRVLEMTDMIIYYVITIYYLWVLWCWIKLQNIQMIVISQNYVFFLKSVILPLKSILIIAGSSNVKLCAYRLEA